MTRAQTSGLNSLVSEPTTIRNTTSEKTQMDQILEMVMKLAAKQAFPSAKVEALSLQK